MTNSKDFEVIIIGGSYAGLSAAMALGRSLRTVLIIDSGIPCNRQTPHSHNFLSRDGEVPAVLAQISRDQVLKYNTIQFLHGQALQVRKTDLGFLIETDDKESFQSQKLVFATGIKDVMPDIKGFAECWGISVVHCPYCHGYEIRNQKTAILANGMKGFHLGSLVRNLTDTITILPSGKADFTVEQLQKLDRHGIAIVENTVAEVRHKNGQIHSIAFKDGSAMEFQAAYAALPFVQHSDLPATLGCELTEQGYLKTDPFQMTTVEGVYACGDNSNMMRSVSNAVHSGNLTGAIINRSLTEEAF